MSRHPGPVVLFANDFPPVVSGISTAFHEIWRRLPPARTEVVAPAAAGSRPIDTAFPVRVIRLPLPVGESTGAKIAKTALTLAWSVAVCPLRRLASLHCGQVVSSGVAGWACRRLFGTPYTVWVYGSETVRLSRGTRSTRILHTILVEARHVIVNSLATSREFTGFGVPEDKLKVIYPGVDPDRFRPLAPDPALMDRLGARGHRVLLTVARLDQRKGHDTVLHTLAELGRDDVVYLIAGTGREERRLRHLSVQLGVQDRVRFLGFVPDKELPALYNLCDVFVMPNRVTEGTALEGDIEGFGITFLEAGACEKPVIGGRSGGAVEAVLDGVTGILVDPHSPKAVADAIGRLLDDPSLAASMGRAARKRIVDQFDWRVLARQVEEIL